ncbi:hypothetical protein EJD97_006900 [Solanum chilense]|uniref:Phytocyanin domain-containing protein n=1 Tax=Solanum chilense TaxID=4083 RepID=A0A6N2AK42_SOLCI|nr:hypothetical protein EJD97_006900 [Solanum chilense]
MEKIVCGALIMAILLQITIAQTEHIVGDSFGWSIPINGAAAYAMWADANSIKIGDTLVFKFTQGNHDVQEVSRSSYEECSTQNSIGEAIKKGPAKITVQTLGDHYYICTVGEHCLAGQKMAIKVTSSNSSASNTPAGSIPPPSSSSNIVLASFLLSLFSITFTIFF